MSSPARKIKLEAKPNWVSTRNPCKACAPMGATLVMRGIEGGVPFLHGSQGCATYMRRYLISHFREPMDIATSGFSEASTIFGGGANLRQGLQNVTSQYKPGLIGIATTCLTETIGEDMNLLLHEYRAKGGQAENAPELVHVATPSYRGTHVDGFNDAVRAVVEQMAAEGALPSAYTQSFLNIFPGMVSAEDLRFLKEVADDFGIPATVFPDYSETLDGPSMLKYKKIPEGGTPLLALHATPAARASIELGRTLRQKKTAASFLQERFLVPAKRIGLPVGVEETDVFFNTMEKVTGAPMPEKYAAQRGRLIDAYVDGHKYVFGKRAIVFGDEDMVVGMTSLLAEIGAQPILCASGGKSGALAKSIAEVTTHLKEAPLVREGVDFMTMAEEAEMKELKPDFMIGSSKGAKFARALGVPLIRVGFPIHDRFGGQRILHLGYRGAQQLFDQIINTLLELKQDSSPIGYSYL
ncbi:MAG: nitrogenase component 1 [Acidobacteriota bacterium]|nr:nitrogenase component 1 [Acidobacteriota bacterium]